ncbi:hypothetical protein HOU08_gp058 [Dickeya phage vB_DsoM_JA29]|uniref:Uncharacterized protein n=1 Tax=Dickeya phage vB_DsoM_JA29 TaxID=2283031 RepID=A0A384ZX27_9CAUD|nr:hypothetical protein HOU08_gp058 [Dickeya phage vB_DsoM_JA29]AXG66784.1 hypothetical protein JA29_058 [Dickeya phage vB_DsoM_JA29]
MSKCLSLTQLLDIRKKMISIVDDRRIKLSEKGMEDPNQTNWSISKVPTKVSTAYQDIGFLCDHVSRLEYLIEMQDTDEANELSEERSKELLDSLPPEFHEETDDSE